MDDPKKTRLIQTRDGIARIPRTEEGVPIRDFFQNTELPENLDHMRVFQTKNGPVLDKPDPVRWTEEQDKKVQDYADRLKDRIENRVRYKASLEQFSGDLAAATGHPENEMKKQIIAKFQDRNQLDPYRYLQQVRAEKGLDSSDQSNKPRQDFEPEM